MAKFRVLGPVVVRAGGRTLDPGPPKRRVVLAILLAELGRPVPIEAMVDRLWDDAPPAKPRQILYAHCTRLRRLLADARDGASTGPELHRTSGGYVLEADPDQVDAHRFDRLVRASDDESLSRERRAQLLAEALELWQGTPLAGLSGAWVERVRQRLIQRHLEAFLTWSRLQLQLGNPDVVAARSSALADDHPLVEPLAVVQIQALYEAGRSAEALDAYETMRRRLADELGIDPGTELQELHQAILRGDPLRDKETQAEADPPPTQLPPDLLSLTGREPEIQALTELATRTDRRNGTPSIGAIDGMAGVGKTALAVHVSHRLADRYPDGRFFLDLHGFTTNLAPMPAAMALERLLRSIGLAGEQIPPDAEERSALWRSRMAGRRYLLVLDNAAHEDQVRPLLAAAPDSLTLVTSRRRLGALQDAHLVSLDVLSSNDAMELFGELTGDERLVARPEQQIAELVELCGRLPLAVHLVASRLRHRPNWTLTDSVRWLRERRLAAFGSGSGGVEVAFGLSYDQLSAGQQRLFRLLGLVPGQDLDAYAAAALANVGLDQAEDALEALVDAHLLESSAYGRYYFHDLLRAYAAGTAERDEPATEHRAALDRLRAYYLRATSEAIRAYAPAEHALAETDLPELAAAGPAFADAAQAMQWLDTERPNLVASVRGAEASYVGPLATWLSGYLSDRAYYSEALAVHLRHLEVARSSADRTEEALAQCHLGETHYRLNRHQAALDSLRRALALLPGWSEAPALRAQVLHTLGCVLEDLGHYPEAFERLTEAARLERTNGDRVGETRTLCALAELDRLFGRYSSAETHARRAFGLARQSGDRLGEAAARRFVGAACIGAGRYDEAVEHCRESLRLYREVGSRPRESLALVFLGSALRGLHRPAEALGHLQRALAIARESANRNSEFEASLAVGETLRILDRADEAVGYLRRALELAGELGQAHDQAQAHHALGAVCLDLGDSGSAGAHLRQAAEIYGRLGVPASGAVEAELERLADET